MALWIVNQFTNCMSWINLRVAHCHINVCVCACYMSGTMGDLNLGRIRFFERDPTKTPFVGHIVKFPLFNERFILTLILAIGAMGSFGIVGPLELS